MNKISGNLNITRHDVQFGVGLALIAAGVALVVIGCTHPAFRQMYPEHTHWQCYHGHWRAVHIPAHMGLNAQRFVLALMGSALTTTVGIVVGMAAAEEQEKASSRKAELQEEKVEVRQEPKHSAQTLEEDALYPL